jgi:hypothetical protein
MRVRSRHGAAQASVLHVEATKEGNMKRLGGALHLLAALAGMATGLRTTAAAPADTCTDGPIAAGTYLSFSIAGACVIPTGAATVGVMTMAGSCGARRRSGRRSPS